MSVYMLEIDEDSRLGLEILNNGPRYDARRFQPTTLRPSSTRPRLSAFNRWASHVTRSRTSQAGARIAAQPEILAMAPSSASARTRTASTVKRAPATSNRRKSMSTRCSPGGRPWRRPQRPIWPKSGSLPACDYRRVSGSVRSNGTVTATPIERFIDAGLLEADADLLRLTPRGVLLSNEVFQEFLAA